MPRGFQPEPQVSTVLLDNRPGASDNASSVCLVNDAAEGSVKLPVKPRRILGSTQPGVGLKRVALITHIVAVQQRAGCWQSQSARTTTPLPALSQWLRNWP